MVSSPASVPTLPGSGPDLPAGSSGVHLTLAGRGACAAAPPALPESLVAVADALADLARILPRYVRQGDAVTPVALLGELGDELRDLAAAAAPSRRPAAVEAVRAAA